MWPQVRCKTEDCGNIGKWKHMFSEKVWSESGGEDDWHWVYTCVQCVKVQKGFATDQEALSHIMQVAGCAVKKQARCDKFKAALEDVQRLFPAMTKRKNIVNMTFEIMQEMWGSLSKHILRKREALEKECEDMAAHSLLAEELKTCTDMGRQNEILEEMEKLATAAAPLAFAKHKEQERMINACTYADSWCSLFWPDGTLKAKIDSYYICRAMVGYEDCLRVTPSKDWGTRGVCPIDASTWDCKCHAKYRAGFGQVVIITRCSTRGQIERYYMAAEVPDWRTMEDIRAMNYEETVAGPNETPEELFKKINRIEPTVDDLIVPCTDYNGPGTKFISREILDQLPKFDWYQIFNMVGVELPPLPAKKSKKRR